MKAFFDRKHWWSSSANPLDDLPSFLAPLRFSSCVFLVDENVAGRFDCAPAAAAIGARVLRLEPSEKLKSVRALASVTRKLQQQIDRETLVVAVGGGALIDFAGCWSGLMFRGIRYVSLPTSTTGMVDSAYGGKTAVNLFAKNQLGLYHHPELVLVNPAFLRTLAPRHFCSGMVEALKLGFFDPRVVEPLTEPRGIETTMKRAALMKLSLLRDDPYETRAGSRLLYGHSFSNAFETFSWERPRRAVPHGFAVAIGMTFSAWLAGKLDAAFARLFAEHCRALSAWVDLPAVGARCIPGDIHALTALLERDKYCVSGKLKIPALFLSDGCEEIALSEISRHYGDWRDAILRYHSEAPRYDYLRKSQHGIARPAIAGAVS